MLHRFRIIAYLSCTLVLFTLVMKSQAAWATPPKPGTKPKPPAITQVAATGIYMTPLAAGLSSPVGIDYHSPTNQVVMSVNYASAGNPYNFELVANDGTRTQFSSISGLSEEVKIATVKDTSGGFAVGEMFTGSGVSGEIVRIAADGSSVQIPWITLPNESGLMRGSLYLDRTGVWGGDLIVVTTAGNVWRINSAGTSTLLASIGTHLEGLITVPNDAERFGPWAGKILVGAEQQTLLYTIDTTGEVESYAFGIAPEDLDLIPENENFYGIDHSSGILWKATADEFVNMVGDLLVTEEGGSLWRMWWDGTTFRSELIASVNHWEHVTFAPVLIDPGPATITIRTETQPASSTKFTLAGPEGNFTLTNSDGANEKIFAVEPDVFVFTELPVAGWSLGEIRCNNGATVNIDLAQRRVTIRALGGEQITCTFVNRKNVTLKALLYHDRNANGRFTNGEPPLIRWVTTIYDSWGIAVAARYSNELGQVNIAELPAAHYTICNTLQNGWRHTQPATINYFYRKPCYDVDPNPGQTITVRFGNTAASLVTVAAQPDPGADDGITVSEPTAEEGLSVPAENSQQTVVDHTNTTPPRTQTLYLPLVSTLR